MKRLKLLKPWRLPTVTLKLYAPGPMGVMPSGPAGDMKVSSIRFSFHNVSGYRTEFCGAPCAPTRKRRTPAGRAIFASTASPHPGCPHLSS